MSDHETGTLFEIADDGEVVFPKLTVEQLDRLKTYTGQVAAADTFQLPGVALTALTHEGAYGNYTHAA